MRKQSSLAFSAIRKLCKNVPIFGHVHKQAGLVLHQGYIPENVTQIEHKIPI